MSDVSAANDQVGTGGHGCPLYAAASQVIIRLDETRSLVFVSDHPTVCEVSPFVGEVLRQCEGLKTLDHHVAALRAAVKGSTQASIAEAVQTLYAAGLLRSADAFPATGIAPRFQPAPISSVIVGTADRPRKLQRCVEALIDQCDRFGRRPRFIVIDGSVDAAARCANQATLQQAERVAGHQTWYVGPAESASLRHHLEDTGVRKEVLAFGLTAGAIGANRNIGLLLSAGENVLMVDDDIICRPWALGDRQGGIAIGGHSDNRHWSFFDSRAGAYAAAMPAAIDMLGAHGELLGRNIADLLSWPPDGIVDASMACGHVLSALAKGRNPAVRVTYAGLAGDSVCADPVGYLLASGSVEHLLRTDPQAFTHAFSSREVLRVARRTTLTDATECMAYCMGVSNRSLLPPFMPRWRAEDAVFGAMLPMIEPCTLFAHLSFGVIHDSHRPSGYDPAQRQLKPASRLCEFIILVSEMLGSTTFASDARERLERAGRCLEDLGELAPHEFTSLVVEALRRARCRELQQVEDLMGAASTPGFWREPLDRYRGALLDHLASAESFLPSEFRQNGPLRAGFEAMQEFLWQFGALIDAWPLLWQAGRSASWHSAPRPS